ncbi:hypothetical protein ACQEVC_42910 [Plantactinospora sp. CA-294935]|uniref:hypothetical protein n=1 Tax=Plantactinospora sp. CA-294935 TaxID=3240012 RepID=UPI003D8CBD02
MASQAAARRWTCSGGGVVRLTAEVRELVLGWLGTSRPGVSARTGEVGWPGLPVRGQHGLVDRDQGWGWGGAATGGGPTWTEFFTVQVKGIRSYDVMRVDTISLSRVYVLFLMEIVTRRVYLLGTTTSVIGEWVA